MAWELPEDFSDNYKVQIDSEVKRDVINKKDGSMKKRWVKIKENHLWDCECMNTAVAMMMGVIYSPEAQEG